MRSTPAAPGPPCPLLRAPAAPVPGSGRRPAPHHPLLPPGLRYCRHQPCQRQALSSWHQQQQHHPALGRHGAGCDCLAAEKGPCRCLCSSHPRRPAAIALPAAGGCREPVGTLGAAHLQTLVTGACCGWSQATPGRRHLHCCCWRPASGGPCRPSAAPAAPGCCCAGLRLLGCVEQEGW